ncbi:maestro heat-like repeat family member 5 [Colius striatus]|uniref:maestro heat-like repeat family member 5 n=1 Tax=Colius striatus TaxID=57412 RepID=UPI002B1DD031|nr:maestro heat-like repeat family member 5 [Colius striatus]
MQALLPDVMQLLRAANAELRVKALLLLHKVMGQLKKKEAGPIAVQLAEQLLPFFVEGLSRLRELSISVFRDLMKIVTGKHKSQMKKKVRRGLVPLLFSMSDQSQSVAQASGDALVTAAELLRWKGLRRLVQSEETERIGEFLLVKDKRGTEGYLNQSLPYLQDPQAPLREAAVRFIGLAGLRGQSQEKMSEVHSALRRVSLEDNEPAIRSLALQTSFSLSSAREQLRSRWRLGVLKYFQ